MVVRAVGRHQRAAVLEVLALGLALQRLRSAFVTPLRMAGWFLSPGFLSLGRIRPTGSVSYLLSQNGLPGFLNVGVS